MTFTEVLVISLSESVCKLRTVPFMVRLDGALCREYVRWPQYESFCARPPCKSPFLSTKGPKSWVTGVPSLTEVVMACKVFGTNSVILQTWSTSRVKTVSLVV